MNYYVKGKVYFNSHESIELTLSYGQEGEKVQMSNVS